MTPTLYFLRSSENKIVQNMLPLAHPQQDNLNIYSDFYGLTSNDLGLYALVESTIAGAIWSRRLNNEEIPTLSIALLEEFRQKGIASAMMKQFLLEAAAEYDAIKIESYNSHSLIKFLKKFDFVQVDNSTLMVKELKREEIVRPSDGYDPKRWMD